MEFLLSFFFSFFTKENIKITINFNFKKICLQTDMTINITKIYRVMLQLQTIL